MAVGQGDADDDVGSSVVGPSVRRRMHAIESAGRTLFLFCCLTSVQKITGIRNVEALNPYLEWEWPPRGHPFIRGEEEVFASISAHHILADTGGEPYSCLVEIRNQHEQIISSTSFGITGQYAQFQQKDPRTRNLQFHLPDGADGKFTLKGYLLRGEAQLDSTPQHMFRIQRSFASAVAEAGTNVRFTATPLQFVATDGAAAPFSLVALVRLRNVERSVQHFLRCLEPFTDQIVVLDDSSEDGTVSAIEAVAEQCRVRKILRKGAQWTPDGYGDMQALLEEGRRIGGTHFAVLHGDEVLTTSLLDGSWREAVGALRVGESLTLGWIHFWKSLRYARSDWMISKRGPRSVQFVDIVFRDDGKCSFTSNRLHRLHSPHQRSSDAVMRHSDDTRKFQLSRIPFDLDGSQLEIRSMMKAVLHFGYVHWQLVLDRVYLQRLVVRSQLPDAHPEAINRIYAEVLDESGVHGIQAFSQIIGNWSVHGIDLSKAYGLQGDVYYAELFSEQYQLADNVRDGVPTVPLPVVDSWYARASASLAAAGGEALVEGITNELDIFNIPDLPPTGVTFSISNSVVDGGPDVELMGTPSVGETRVSVLVCTKRPGGLDAILHSLHQQTRKDFDVVVVDELWEREQAFRRRAGELGIKVTAISTSKPKASEQAFGFQNAWNTGLASTTSPYLAIVNDYTWLPPIFIEMVVTFYEGAQDDLPPPHLRRSTILSFPIVQYAVPEDYLDRDLLMNRGSLSVFTSELDSSPSSRGWAVSDRLGPRDTFHTRFKPHWFWDGQAMVATRGMIEAINGFDEVLDYGNDCHMQNIRDRAALLGGQVWLAPAKVAVQEIDHHNWFEKGETEEFLMFNRLTKDSNLNLWASLIERIKLGEYALQAGNFGFRLSDFYQRQLELEASGGEDEGSEQCRWSGSHDNWRCHI